MDILKEPVGKQDQYIAAYGGITCFRFLPNGQVEAWPLKISQRMIYDLEDNLLLFFTGLHPLGGRDPQGAGRQEQEERSGHDRQSAFRQADWPGHQGRAGRR